MANIHGIFNNDINGFFLKFIFIKQKLKLAIIKGNVGSIFGILNGDVNVINLFSFCIEWILKFRFI